MGHQQAFDDYGNVCCGVEWVGGVELQEAELVVYNRILSFVCKSRLFSVFELEVCGDRY